MQRIEDFIKATKPRAFTGYHFAVMLLLMHEGQAVQLSHTMIGERTGMSRYTVRNVLLDCEAWKWLSISSGKRQYNTSLIEVQWGNLPQPEPSVPLVISEHATKLAEGFKTRPLRKDWKRR
jgi:hypothetical protein